MREQETELEMARRHVRRGTGHVARQREIVAKLRAGGQPAEVALQLLASFEAAQRQHEEHLARLEGGPPAVAAEGGGANPDGSGA